MDRMLNIEYIKRADTEFIKINNQKVNLNNLKEALYKFISIDTDKDNLQDILIDYMVTKGSEEYTTYGDDTYETKYTIEL